jgi:hypothetical protein
MALQVALLVAFTQLIPEHQVQIIGVIKARVKVCHKCFPDMIVHAVSEPTSFISHGFFRSLYHWIPIPVDAGSVRLVCRLGVLEVLQKEHKRIIWWSRFIR